MRNIINNLKSQKITDKLRNDIIEYINDEFIITNIVEQIQNLEFKEIEKNVNFIDLFKSRVNSILDLANNSEDGILLSTVERLRIEFYGTVLQALQDVYGFTIDFRNNLLQSEIEIITESLYKFFVIDVFDNIVDYVSDYIWTSKENIKSQYSINKNDVLQSAMIEKYGNEGLLLYYMSNILETVPCDNLYDFVRVITNQDPEEYNNILVSSVFSELDTYVDLGLELGKCKFLENNIKHNYRLRIQIDNAITKKIDKTKR